MIERIEKASHIVLIAHQHPDADSLGAASAFYSYLLRLQKKITFYCSTPQALAHLRFLPWSEKVSARFPKEADLAISFDCGTFGRLGIAYEGELINFDHHVSNEYYGTYNCVDSDAISTTQVVYDWFVSMDIKINGKMANALYAGLMDDSKCFRDPRCGIKIMSMAQRLIELGADHPQCVDALYHSHSLASLRLKGKMLNTMRLLLDGRLALFELSSELLEQTGATLDEAKEVLEEAMALKRVKAAVMIASHPQKGVKISLRSNGALNAAQIMEYYRGGGHRDRAGARITDRSSDDIVHEIIESIKKELE